MLSSERMFHRDYGYKDSVGGEKEFLVMSLKQLGPKMN
jgi:hypothetical protein